MAATKHFSVLRLHYQEAFSLYKHCIELRNRELSAGREPSADLRDREDAALRELHDARDRLLRAL